MTSFFFGKIDGKLEAPRSVKEWGVKSEYWLCFEKVTGLVLTGSGLLHAHGGSWWSSVPSSSRPTALRFGGCNNLLYNGLTQRDSPSNHIKIIGCTNATLSNLHIIAPGNSPNTDGIDIADSHNIHILSSSIKTGDDCVAIIGSSSDINITRVGCGPGHGISVGSLGKGGTLGRVQNVNVRHCTFYESLSAARIKTWSATAVKVSDVTFRDFRGTSTDTLAININCDRGIGCDNILMEHINITSSSPRTRLTAFCRFAHVISRFVSISIRCVSRDEDSRSPSPLP
ncbi:unnamed protein product [Microthlaspi erraticum]|uniref:Pectate lyase domain-containing protein n=1 Tax=Microthlaspi erraticum TaxID=1685480 RepID=A0A6D2IB06_9BRAS|nr:unnamed protein product [Microthlaspi erraticum]